MLTEYDRRMCQLSKKYCIATIMRLENQMDNLETIAKSIGAFTPNIERLFSELVQEMTDICNILKQFQKEDTMKKYVDYLDALDREISSAFERKRKRTGNTDECIFYSDGGYVIIDANVIAEGMDNESKTMLDTLSELLDGDSYDDDRDKDESSKSLDAVRGLVRTLIERTNHKKHTNNSDSKEDKPIGNIIADVLIAPDDPYRYVPRCDVSIKKVHKDAIMPEYKHNGDAGFDLHAINNHVLHPGVTASIGTGLCMAFPPSLELQIRLRSGAALSKSIIIPNAPATIDSNYRGEIKIIVTNIGDSVVTINNGERIAQGILSPIAIANFKEVDELPGSERGTDGFGSTGNK